MYAQFGRSVVMLLLLIEICLADYSVMKAGFENSGNSKIRNESNEAVRYN